MPPKRKPRIDPGNKKPAEPDEKVDKPPVRSGGFLKGLPKRQLPLHQEEKLRSLAPPEVRPTYQDVQNWARGALKLGERLANPRGDWRVEITFEVYRITPDSKPVQRRVFIKVTVHGFTGKVERFER